MSQKLPKVLYISYDGAKEPIPQSQVLPYLMQLSAKGLDIQWLSYDKRNSFEAKKEKINFKNELMNYGIKWYSITYHKKPVLLAKIYDIAFGLLYASYIVFKDRIKIVHGRSEVASLIALLLKWIFRVNFIYDRRGFMAEDYIDGGIWKDRKSIIYKLSLYVDKKLLLSADKIVVLTKKIRDILIDTHPHFINKISVIPCCVDLKKFTFHKNERLSQNLNINGKFAFLYSGSISTWYMPEEMLKFFEIIKKVLDNSHFLILTKENKLLENVLQKNENNISIVNVEHNLVPQYLSIAKVGLAFYKQGYSRKARSPTKLGEYLACELPVVINAGIGDCDEIILKERVGVVINEFSSKEYERAIDELKGLLSEGKRLRERCRATAEKYFSLEMGVERYWEIYKRLGKE